MATSKQTVLEQFGRYEYQLGDLIEQQGTGRTDRLRLTECPLCAADPNRPRHRFGETEKPAVHIATVHGR